MGSITKKTQKGKTDVSDVWQQWPYSINSLDLLMPGAAMVTREMTTCVMPLTAAFCNAHKMQLENSIPYLESVIPKDRIVKLHNLSYLPITLVSMTKLCMNSQFAVSISSLVSQHALHQLKHTVTKRCMRSLMLDSLICIFISTPTFKCFYTIFFLKLVKRIYNIHFDQLLTLEWPSLFPSSSVTAMPFKISLCMTKHT